MKSIPPEWHRLFSAACNLTLQAPLSERDREALSSLLKSSPEARKLWFLYQDIDCSLAELRNILPVATGRPPHPWFSWRSLAVAASGLVAGLLSAPMLLGHLIPRPSIHAFRVPGFLNGGFETQTGPLPPGFPSMFGAWSGDPSEIVPNVPSLSGNGTSRLRFLRADRETVLQKRGPASCDVYQTVDLRPLRKATASRDAQLELSAQFLDSRDSSGDRLRFICRLRVFSGSPDSLIAEWPLTQKEALASGVASLESAGGDPTTWHPLKTKVILPENADFAVVHLVVHRLGNPTSAAAEFGLQFADEVQLTLQTQPRLPVKSTDSSTSP